MYVNMGTVTEPQIF